MQQLQNTRITIISENVISPAPFSIIIQNRHRIFGFLLFFLQDFYQLKVPFLLSEIEPHPPLLPQSGHNCNVLSEKYNIILIMKRISEWNFNFRQYNLAKIIFKQILSKIYCSCFWNCEMKNITARIICY